MKKRVLVIVLILSSFGFAYSPTNDPLSQIVKGFERYLENLPQEKIYLHFDRPYYAAGETIWYKAYLTAGTMHEPSPFSHAINVELLNDKGTILQSVKLLAYNSAASGDFQLADTLPTGNYVVRAYTNWMRNVPEDYFFHKTLKIWNIEDNSSTASMAEEVHLSFFPEGGEMVEGIMTRLAIKAIGTDGLSRNVSGTIVDEAGVAIAEFKCNNLGMGLVTFVPQLGKRYIAKLKDGSKEFALPNIKKSGVVMSVKNTANVNDLLLRVQTTPDANPKIINIIAQSRGIVCFAGRADISSNVVMTKIPKANFPTGVAQITITDQQGKPLAERLVFIDGPQEAIAQVLPNKSTYDAREMVKLAITVKDNDGKPLKADLSLAATDDLQVLVDPNEGNIQTYILLTSDLRGHIETPGYYFNPENADREEALDLLMLTQGWRRFTIAQALDENWQGARYRFEQGLTVSGQLIDKHSKKPLSDGKVSYLAFDPFPDSRNVRTDANGRFEMHDIVYFDTAKVVLQGENKKGGNYVTITMDKKTELIGLKYPTFPLPGSQQDFEKAFIAKSIERKSIDASYNFDEKTIILDGIEIKTERENRNPTRNAFLGGGSASIKADDVPMANVLQHPLQLIQGRVAGVTITGNGNEWTVRIQGVNSINSGTTPLFLIDDLPVDIESLQTLPVLEIESVTVWKGADAGVFGARGTNGAIGFYTKRGGNSFVRPTEGIFPIDIQGFKSEREFYAPKYAVVKPEHVKPDRRPTLFWAPYVATDSTGATSISFYNHDLETSVTGILEGITPDGKTIVTKFKYDIKGK